MVLMIVISSILIIAQTIIFVLINKSNKKRKEKEKYTMVDMILYEQNKKMNEGEEVKSSARNKIQRKKR